ncbi:LysR family transcriptional regulator [Maricaulaceae bacterium MS644]
MDMQQVEYFLAVSKTLNFTRAAEQCDVSQPTLTRAVRAIEQELGGALLRREGKYTHLTDLGERMLPFLRRSYDNAQFAKSLARAVNDEAITPLSLGVANGVDLALYIGAISELYRRFPGLQLRINRGTNSYVLGLLKGGRAEIALAGRFMEGWDRLNVARLFEDELAVFVEACDALASQDALTLQALSGRPLFLNVGCDTLDPLMDWLSANLEGFRGANVIDGGQDIGEIARGRHGAIIAPASASTMQGFVRKSCPALDLRRDVNAYTVSGRPQSLSAAAFLNQIRTACAPPFNLLADRRGGL